MLGLAPHLLCSAYATGSRQAVSSRRCDAPRCSLLADLATAPALADLASVPLLPGAAALVAASVAGAALATRPTGPVGAPYPADAKGYDPEAADAFYGARLPFVASRLLTLGSITLAFNVRLGLDYLAYKNAGAPEGEPWPNEADRAKEALSLATQLGPTFIKLCQWAASRDDLFPVQATRRFARLHDRVEPHAYSETLISVQHAFGDGLTIDEAILGSGCVAQVHRGVLEDGRCVAIKVVHPGVRELVDCDMHLLRYVGSFLEYWTPSLKYLAVRGTIQRFEKVMRAQLDLAGWPETDIFAH